MGRAERRSPTGRRGLSTSGSDTSARTTDQAGARARDLPRLTSLRAFAALAVFGFHLEQDHVWSTGGLFAAGFSGVAFFFVLSGFVLTWTWRPGTGTGRFYQRRFARVWPSHAVMLIASIAAPVVATQHRGVISGLLNLLLLQSWSTDPATAFGYNGVSWSLSCEAFFYACFPLIVSALARLTPGQRWLATAVISGTTGLLLIAGGTHRGLLEHAPPVRLGEFVLGCTLALSVRDGWRPRVPMLVAAPLAILVPALVAQAQPTLVTAATEVTTAVLLLAAATADLDQRAGWLCSRPLVYAGQVSFAFYLVHELVMLNLDLTGATGAALALLITSVLAIALHHAVERPAQRALTPTSS
ncbi:MAG: acyltransferase 3 [Frankiales bacterium]|nr:acyltransferase 3 [Frankiales bacterium]